MMETINFNWYTLIAFENNWNERFEKHTRLKYENMDIPVDYVCIQYYRNIQSGNLPARQRSKGIHMVEEPLLEWQTIPSTCAI